MTWDEPARPAGTVRRVGDDWWQHTAHGGARGLREVPDLLGGHDAVVIMGPYNGETHHLVDARFLARMPDGAFMVNAARGPVVDTGALLGS